MVLLLLRRLLIHFSFYILVVHRKSLQNYETDRPITDASFRLRENYEKYLLSFEYHLFPWRKPKQDEIRSIPSEKHKKEEEEEEVERNFENKDASEPLFSCVLDRTIFPNDTIPSPKTHPPLIIITPQIPDGRRFILQDDCIEEEEEEELELAALALSEFKNDRDCYSRMFIQ